MRTFCTHLGCSHLAMEGSRRCEEHGAKKKVAAGETPRSHLSAHKRGYGVVWRRLRKMVLAEEPFCMVCKRNASAEVDHIIPKFEGGGNERENLQGICIECHQQKTIKDSGNEERSHENIRIVNGAPYAGKRAYVYSQVRRNDIVFDWDKMMAAVIPVDPNDITLGMAIRDVVVKHSKRIGENRKAFIILTDYVGANEICDQTGGRLIIIDKGQDAALRAAHDDGNRKLESVINAWYASKAAHIKRYGKREKQIEVGEAIYG